eukprot:TRINITY_DN106383_c0_g1_i1.p1 TRINITY_DN106383_c0_g1~~TRINITY_DN106383_c0_g1_i1.p1  ORF type:complete len:164 (-),score=30.21 TRINITY_DN106383_c0_g1_i1:570-1061(-)
MAATIIVINAVDGSELANLEVEVSATIRAIKQRYDAPPGARLLSHDTTVLSDDETLDSYALDGTITLKQVVDSVKAAEVLYKEDVVLELKKREHVFCPGTMSSSAPTSYTSYQVVTAKSITEIPSEAFGALVSEAKAKAWRCDKKSEWTSPEDYYNAEMWNPN